MDVVIDKNKIEILEKMLLELKNIYCIVMNRKGKTIR
jgi:hypothetical protein